MRRDTTNILLILTGGALIKITMDGTYLRYVKPTAQPWILLAGSTMIALAAAAIGHDLAAGHTPRGGHAPHPDHTPHAGCASRAGHATRTSHQHHASPAWLLLLPVLAIFLITPPALGADSVLRAGNRTAPPTTQDQAAFPPLPNTAVVPMALTDFITRSVWDQSRSLHGRTVALTGFVVHAHDTDYVARLVITCCAADATPMKVALTGQTANQLPNDQWIQVTGRLRPGSATETNGYIPTLTVSSLATIAPPTNPYEY